MSAPYTRRAGRLGGHVRSGERLPTQEKMPATAAAGLPPVAQDPVMRPPFRMVAAAASTASTIFT